MKIGVDTVVYVPDEYFASTIREYTVREVRERDGDIVYLCKATQKPYEGYTFLPAHVGKRVFLDRESAEQSQ